MGAENGGHDTHRQMEYMKLLRFPLWPSGEPPIHQELFRKQPHRQKGGMGSEASHWGFLLKGQGRGRAGLGTPGFLQVLLETDLPRKVFEEHLSFTNFPKAFGITRSN